MNSKHSAHNRWLPVVLGIVVAISAFGSQAWASPQMAPQRQTVPLTPPPTWTPATLPTQEPTRPVPPTPGDAPPQDIQTPIPWVGLGADTQVAGPGDTVILHLHLVNQGTGLLSDAELVLPLPQVLGYVGTIPANVPVGWEGNAFVWRVGDIEAGGERMVDVTLQVAADVLPNQRIELFAELRWPDGTITSNGVFLELPWALLP